jgi:heat shock protein HtpX
MVSSSEEMEALTKSVRSEDIIRMTEGYGFINCECGMNIKVPPDFGKFEVKCPRCGRRHVLAEKMQGTLSAMFEESADAGAAAPIIREVLENKEEEEQEQPDYTVEKEQDYERNGIGWQEIECRCGNMVQLSPTFVGKFISCRKCKRRINIVYKQGK